MYFPSPKEILGNQIKDCLKKINTLNNISIATPQFFEDYHTMLLEYQKNKLFAEMSPKLQKKLQEALDILAKKGVSRLEIINIDSDSEQSSISEVMDVDPESEQSTAVFIQIPSKHDISVMAGMPAGAEEDQEQRLKNMVRCIERAHPDIPVIDTKNVSLPGYWHNLFEAINDADKKKARLNTIPKEDSLLSALLDVHSSEYLQQIINKCIAAQKTEVREVENDVVITPRLFEILIRDLATSIQVPAQCLFSFGLPTHHAYDNKGNGFCILNKTAVLLRYAERTHSEPVKYIIVGTDINRDDGLSNILREKAAHLPICHVDIFDSRVYPHHNFTTINKEFRAPAQDIGQEVRYWSQDNFFYHAIDLSLTQRSTQEELHPALQFALNSIQEHIASAKELGDKIILFIPMGWDSLEDETADCAKMINGEKMSLAEAQVARFNNNDLRTFYETIFTLYKNNKECFAQLYWGLEGGYNQPMYEQQITLLLDSIAQHLIEPNAEQQSTHRINF